MRSFNTQRRNGMDLDLVPLNNVIRPNFTSSLRPSRARGIGLQTTIWRRACPGRTSSVAFFDSPWIPLLKQRGSRRDAVRRARARP